MAFTVTVQPGGMTFSVEDGATVLEAGLEAGVVLPYGCKNGACGSCKARVLEGTFELGAHQERALSASEAREGHALMCCTRPCSNLVVQARVVSGLGDIAVRKMPCRVAEIERIRDDVALIRLQLPANERFQYLPGQYIELIMRDGARRSYSMAKAPGEIEQIELHIRHMPGGRFTDQVFGASTPALKVRDILRMEGPMGTFFLREDSERPMVLLASGTGFAPMQAILGHMKRRGLERQVRLYWGGRRPKDLYRDDWVRDLLVDAERKGVLEYIPVVSDALAEDGWTGRTGFVHQAVVDDLPDLSGWDVYACGAPIVVESARQALIEQCGLPEDRFFADSFTSAADSAG